MRRGGRLAAAFLVPTFLVQSTGAADLAFLSPVRAPIMLSAPLHMPRPIQRASLRKEAAAPRVVPPDPGLWGLLRDRMAPTVNAWDRWLDEPMDPPDPAAWLAALFKEGARPLPVPTVAPAAVPEPAPIAAAAEAVAEPAQDRMLIDHHDFDMVLFGQDARDWRAGLPSDDAVAPRLEGPWHQANGLRFRINYLKPKGYCKVGPSDAEIIVGSRMTQFQRIKPLPPAYWRTYALYFGGEVVNYEIELENLTGRDLQGLLVFSNQEAFNVHGGLGKLLGQVQMASLKSLDKGGRAVLMGQARLSGFEAAGGNFEQTHLSVARKAQTAAARAW